jgi:uncharacterized membrane protein
MSFDNRGMKSPFPYLILTPHRLEAFFDAVFAIIMTILVLGLTLPGDEDLSLIALCMSMLPQIIHFTVAFFILAAFWGAHHRFFSIVKKLDMTLIRLTFIVLFVACLLPFTSTLAGDNHTQGSAVLLFHLNMLILGLLFLIQWIYVHTSHLSTPIPDHLYRFILIKSSIVPAVSVLGIMISFISPPWSSLCYFFIPLLEWSLLHLKNDETIRDSDHEPSLSESSLSVTLPKEITTTLDEVAHEMNITKEKLIMFILARWATEQDVNIGKQGHLCTFVPDEPRE